MLILRHCFSLNEATSPMSGENRAYPCLEGFNIMPDGDETRLDLEVRLCRLAELDWRRQTCCAVEESNRRINSKKLTHGGHQRCTLLCARNHQARPRSSFHVRRHRRGSRAGTCGRRCVGQPRSRRSRI